MIEDINYQDEMACHFDYKNNPGKNIRTICSMILLKPLKDNERFFNFIIYHYEAVFVAPPIIKRKCITFLFIKNCKNIKVEQTITEKQINFYLEKVMNPKIYNHAQLLLPKEYKSEFYEIFKKNIPIKF